jgi:hypothetical protein
MYKSGLDFVLPVCGRIDVEFAWHWHSTGGMKALDSRVAPACGSMKYNTNLNIVLRRAFFRAVRHSRDEQPQYR